MLKALPIGIDDFKELILGDYYFVDKSLFIKDVIESKAKATLIPRPRRFGKTLNLSMLNYFFEKTEHSHAHLFTGSAQQGRQGLAIAGHADIMAHQGQY
ncbi:MAG: AAA family ATPase, partial [Candidatus Dependentiae bacterium]|nr:AAA family ATPase [Candidatus Dependentiae bacterium]